MPPKKTGTAKPKKAATHPKYADMVAEAIRELKEHTGSSRQAIVKYIEGKYKVGEAGHRQINLALKRGVEKGTLVHPKGHGGSYRLAAKAKAAPKKAAAKKTTAKKTSTKKKAAPKKKTSAKKAAPKKKASAKKSKKAAA